MFCDRSVFFQAYKIVENWPTKNIDPLMTALELLDVDYPDPFVRFSAVRLLDTRIDDDRLLPVILQIVQVKRNLTFLPELNLRLYLSVGC